MKYKAIIILLSSSLAIVLVPLIWYVTVLSTYLFLVFWIYILFITLYGGFSFLRGQWKLGGICCLPLLLALAFRFGGNQFFFVQDIGFQTMAFLSGDFSKRCSPIIFLTDDNVQSIGICKRMDRYFFKYYDYIMLDTSGQIAWPVARRTRQWKVAAESLPNGKVLAAIKLDVRRLTGPFYVIHFNWQDEDRTDY